MMNFFQKLHGSLETDGKKRAYYAAYTLLFFILAFFVFFWCILSGRSLISDTDGEIYFRLFIYVGQYFRQVIRNLLIEHRLIIPDWDFYIFEGVSILNTLHLFGFGDPIFLLSVFIPTRFAHYFYSIFSILRLYLAGIAFSALAFGTKCKNRYGILAGALSYSFCAWEVFHAASHIYFLNPCIYFPLVILGVEKVIRKERPYLLIVSVALAAACNFYYFYMIVLLTVVYTLIRVGLCYGKDLKGGIRVLLQIGGLSLVGACLAGIIALPMLAIFLQDSRLSGATQAVHLLYPLLYYIELPAIAMTCTSPYELSMGFSAPAILALFLLLFSNKSNRLLKMLFGVCLLIILFPVFGWLLNGTSYVTNRWSWAFALLCSYILTREWDVLICPSRSDWKKMLIGSLLFLIYVPCLLFAPSAIAVTYLPVILLLFLSLLLVRNARSDAKSMRKRQSLLLLAVCISVINLGFGLFSPAGLNFAAAMLVPYDEVFVRQNDNETGIVKELSDVFYPRYSGQSIAEDANISSRISNTQYFWSLSNPYTNRFRSDLKMREDKFSHFQGYDDRTSLLALSAVQYYVADSANAPGMPYGYAEVGSENNRYFVYKNQYALPLGYCYDSYVTRETWESLDAVQKQELQLEAAYMEDYAGIIAQYAGQVTDYSIPYQLKCPGNGIVETESGFVTTAADTTAVLSFEGKENTETYLYIEGLEFEKASGYSLNLGELLSGGRQVMSKMARIIRDSGDSSVDLTIESSANVKKVLTYVSPDSTSPDGSSTSTRHDFIINLGYMEEPVTSISISFQREGIYTIENLRVYSVPMEGYAEKIGALQRDTLQNIRLGTDEVCGELTLDSPKLLCMAIPYSPGWTASVDGVETPVMPANKRYLGISVPAGSHTVEFHYHTPYKNIGLVLSLAGLAALSAIVVATEKRRRESKPIE